MALEVTLPNDREITHRESSKWVIDESQTLHIIGQAGNTASYGRGSWVSVRQVEAPHVDAAQALRAETTVAARALRAAINEAKEANEKHIPESGGDGYASGFHYALSCIEASAEWLESAQGSD